MKQIQKRKKVKEADKYQKRILDLPVDISNKHKDTKKGKCEKDYSDQGVNCLAE